jgi:hypothetical protein
MRHSNLLSEPYSHGLYSQDLKLNKGGQRGPERATFPGFPYSPSAPTSRVARHHEFMAQLPHSAGILALSVDGLLPGDEGGTVTLRDDGRVRLDYPLGPALQESFRVAMREIARIHLAAGAKAVYSLHTDGVTLTSEADLPRLEQAPYGALQHAIFTAHQMGGCSMGADKATSVVDSKLRHHKVRNLFVVEYEQSLRGRRVRRRGSRARATTGGEGE